ncbi:hypothetical protein ABPG72_011161 [Tetrahymena utriculariae]
MAIDQTNGLIVLSAVNDLSFITSLTDILVYIFNRNFSCFSHDLVIMICASDLLYCFLAISRSIWMLSDSNAYIDGVLCFIQAIYIQTFDISSCICTTSATLTQNILCQCIGCLNSLFYAIVSLKMFGCECVSSSKQENEDFKQRFIQRQIMNFKNIESNLSFGNQDTRAETKVLSQKDNLEWEKY